MNTTVPSHIFKSYDIRGIYPDEINEENIEQITKAIYKFLLDGQDKNISVVVGHDMRLSSPKLSEIIIDTLTTHGAEVIDIGLTSTTTFYFSTMHYGYDAGIIITASHNPKEYNGLKIVKRGEAGLIKIGKPTGMEQIQKYAVEGVTLPEKEGNVVKLNGMLNDEIDNALTLFEVEPKDIKKLKIVADPANAMGAQYLEELFKKVPAELIKMNFELDGTFPAHQADPLQAETLVDLQKKVKEEKADLGLAPDGDGDRMFFIDERGEVVPSSLITALVAREIIREIPKAKIVLEQKYIFTTKKIVEEEGGQPILCRTGHAFITEKMNETGAEFAGEASGHFYYNVAGNAESQIATVLAILKILSRTDKPFSQVLEDVRRSFESGEINFEVENTDEILDAIKEKYADAQISTMDGVSISYPTWRTSLRSSNTEPLLRLNIEADTKEEVEEKKKEIIEIIETNKK